MWCRSIRAKYLMSSPSQSTFGILRYLYFCFGILVRIEWPMFIKLSVVKNCFFIIFNLSQTNTLLNTAKLNYHKSEKKIFKAKDSKIQTWISFLLNRCQISLSNFHKSFFKTLIFKLNFITDWYQQVADQNLLVWTTF